MDFKKKLKTRLYTAIAYIVLGVAFVVTAIIFKAENDYLSPIGLALAVIGLARVKQYLFVCKNDQKIKEQEIRENDERNIAISNKAKNFSFNLYIILACIAVIVLQILNTHQLAQILGLTVCALLVFYWISYFIFRKKM